MIVKVPANLMPNTGERKINFIISKLGSGYGATEEEIGRPSRQVVRIKSRREDDSPSPDDLTPVHARP